METARIAVVSTPRSYTKQIRYHIQLALQNQFGIPNVRSLVGCSGLGEFFNLANERYLARHEHMQMWVTPEDKRVLSYYGTKVIDGYPFQVQIERPKSTGLKDVHDKLEQLKAISGSYTHTVFPMMLHYHTDGSVSMDDVRETLKEIRKVNTVVYVQRRDELHHLLSWYYCNINSAFVANPKQDEKLPFPDLATLSGLDSVTREYDAVVREVGFDHHIYSEDWVASPPASLKKLGLEPIPLGTTPGKLEYSRNGGYAAKVTDYDKVLQWWSERNANVQG